MADITITPELNDLVRIAFFEMRGAQVSSEAPALREEIDAYGEELLRDVGDAPIGKVPGIDICRKVRQKMDNDDIKLVLFTADESPQTRQEALNSGADAVVVKSPEASEIIHTVSNFLKM